MMTPPGPLTLPRMQQAGAFWQRTLRLQDYDIAYRVVRESALGSGLLGRCHTSVSKKEALIQLAELPDATQGSWPELPIDWERTLVHEMLHIHLHLLKIPVSGAENDAEERAIEALSGVLVSLTRAPLPAEDPA